MVTPSRSEVARIVESAIRDVYVPAMRRYIAREFPNYFDEGEDWLDRVIQDWRPNDRAEIGRLVNHKRLVEDGSAKPETFVEPKHLRTLVNRYADAFPPMLWRYSHLLDSVRGSRNVTEHGDHLSELVGAQQALGTCRAVLTYLEDRDAVSAIEGLQGQLDNLEAEDATNLAEQDDGPRAAQPEGAANLAEQDGGPPARRTGGSFGVGRTRGWFWPLAGLLAFIAVAIGAGVCASSSSNGPPVCSDIGDVALTGPGDPNGTVALSGYCTDADNDEITFTAASSDNDIVSAAVAGELLTLTAGDGSGGAATITVTATDPDGRSATESFEVTVDPPPQQEEARENQRPDCVDVDDITVVEGGEQEVSVSCSDDDGDTITLRVSAGSQTDYYRVSPDTARIDGQGAQRFIIAGLRPSAGAGYVEIEADDGNGGTDEVRFSVVVNADMVEVDEGEPTGTEQPSRQAPEIEGGISCTPSPVAVNASVTCEVSLSEGTPPFAYEWSGGSSSNTTGDSYSTSFGAEGSHSVALRVSNAVGSDDASTIVQVMTPPTIDSRNLGCPSSATENQAVTCSPSVSGTGPLTYRWSGGDAGGSGSSYSLSWSATGTKTVSLTVTNAVGSDDGKTSVVVNEDVQPPEIDSISCTPSPVATNTISNCRANLSGGAPDSYSWSGGGSGSSASYRASFSAPGQQEVQLMVRNTAGDDSDSTTVRVMMPPSIRSVSCSPSETGTGSSVYCDAIVSGTGPLTYMWSGGDRGGSSSSYSPSWNSAGTQTIQLSLRNDVGDVNQSTTVSVIRAPRINSISCSPSPTATNTNVTCMANLSGGTPDFYEWSGGDSDGSRETYRTSFSLSGAKTVRLTVGNAAGRDTRQATVEVRPEPPVIDGISCSPSRPDVGENVTCTANLSGGTPDFYSWSGGDSGSSRATYDTSFSLSGAKTVRLTVGNTADSDTRQITVEVLPEPPEINISCSPSSIAEGDRVTCSVTRNSGGAIVTYSWSTRSGSPNSGSNSTYGPRFDTEGMYTVSLTASNVGGDHTHRTTVSVIRAPRIDRINCRLLPVADVTCVADLSGGEPDFYEWSGGDSSGSGETYDTSFSSSGRKTVQLTVGNAAGRDTLQATVEEPPVEVELPSAAPTCDLEDLSLVEGDDERLYLADHCDDYSGGDRLTFDAESSNSSVVSLSGPDGRRGRLWVYADGGGWATITVRATDSAGQTGVARFTVTVTGDVACSLDPNNYLILTSLTSDPATYMYALRCQDPTGAQLSYTLTSDNNNVAAASYDGNTLTISIRGRGDTIIQFTATAPDGRRWRERFAVYVNP